MSEDLPLSSLIIGANLGTLDFEDRNRLLKYLDVWSPCGRKLSMFPGVSDSTSIGAIHEECLNGYAVGIDMLYDIANETSGGRFYFEPLVHIAMISSAISKEEVSKFIIDFDKNFLPLLAYLVYIRDDMSDHYANDPKLPLAFEALNRVINRQKLLNGT